MNNMIDEYQRSRRSFFGKLGFTALGLASSTCIAAETHRAPRILLRSSWQTVNIGDIAHTPGVLSLLRRYLPAVEVTLWPSNVDNGVEQLLKKEFPKLVVAKPGTESLEQAFESCDFLLHGSGASIVAENDLVRWREKTGKPYGIYGITFPMKKSAATETRTKKAVARSIEVINRASFVFFRDSKSLELARELGAKCPNMEFGPDAAFACDLRDANRAEAFLKTNKLRAGKFLCCIPRLRYTPYWTIKDGVKFDAVKNARNEEMKEHDHKPLLDAITDVVTQTDMKVLICPEDRTQMALGKEMLYDRLIDSVRDRVVWRPNYWLTGEALSVYICSAGLFGNEMHSPIMCIGHGVPALVCRFAEQTSKGLMWNDIGLSDWLFDHDSAADQAKIASTVLKIARNPEVAKEKAIAAKSFVEKRQKETMEILRVQLDA